MVFTRSKRSRRSISMEKDEGMAQAKHQKSKPRRQSSQPHRSKKRGGKHNDVSELREQLDALGLKIIQVTADGNCFFRALADQLEGDEDEHEKYRGMVVQFIKNNREMFEPFVEDEVPFEEYCQTMGQDGTWAGHMELQAASLVTHINICIHRHMSPCWYIQNFNEDEAQMIHLSYHDGEHYNSVRLKEDTCSGPARPIVIKGDDSIPAKVNQPATAARLREEGGGLAVPEESINIVKSGTGCDDMTKVEQVLQQVGGNVDAAIEVLVAEQAPSDPIISEGCLDEQLDENPEQCDAKGEDKGDSSGNNGDDTSKKSNCRQSDEKKILRNQSCPCGSRKKYKSCSSAVAGKSSTKFPLNQTVDYGKSLKERMQARKGEQLLQQRAPFNPMEGHQTWEHSASNNFFQAMSETDSAPAITSVLLRRNQKGKKV